GEGVRGGAMPRFFLLIGLLVLLTAAGLPAAATNPKVSLQVENATAAEAAAALSKAARVPGGLGLPVTPPARDRERLQERGTFDWREATFAGALRQLCERYDLVPGRGPSGYLLALRSQLGGTLPALLARPPAQWEKEGTRVVLRSAELDRGGGNIIVVRGQLQGFAGQLPGAVLGPLLTLSLSCRLPAGDPDAVAGIENLVAR